MRLNLSLSSVFIQLSAARYGQWCPRGHAGPASPFLLSPCPSWTSGHSAFSDFLSPQGLATFLLSQVAPASSPRCSWGLHSQPLRSFISSQIMSPDLHLLWLCWFPCWKPLCDVRVSHYVSLICRLLSSWEARVLPCNKLCHNFMAQDFCCCCCSVTKLCLTLCDPMDCSTLGFLVLRYLPEFAQIHVHWVGDAIQLTHPLPPSSPFAFHLPQHQGFFPVSWLFTSTGQSIGASASASVLPMNIQGWRKST